MGKKRKKLSEQAVRNTFREKHGDKYEYRFPEKFTIKTRIAVTCNVHGVFYQTIEHHMGGQGCRKCALAKTHENNRLGAAAWVKRFEDVHGRGKYDYSKVTENIVQHGKIEIRCPEHGVSFFQTPNTHWRLRQGCPECGRGKRGETSKLKRISRREFVKRARAVHGLAFEYSELPAEFGLNDGVIIFCNEHGRTFFCTAKEHLAGGECLCCVKNKNSPPRRGGGLNEV